MSMSLTKPNKNSCPLAKIIKIVLLPSIACLNIQNQAENLEPLKIFINDP